MGVQQVEAGIYRVPSVLGVRRFAQWLIAGDDRVLLIDSGVHGTIAEHVAPALAEIGRSPADVAEVVISHADVDHYGGNAELRRLAPEARIRAHPLDRPLIESWATISDRRYGWYRRFGLDYDQATWSWLRDAAGPDTALDGAVAGGERIDAGGLAVEVLELPGHSLGHLGVLHRETGTAIVMDAVLERGLYTTEDELIAPPPYVDVAAYRSTIHRLLELAPRRLGTSHYAPVDFDAVAPFLARSLAFVDDLDAAVRDRLAADPQPLAAFLAAADAALGPFRDMSVELARSVGAHLEALEASGVARREPREGIDAWAAA